jgi:hypothetical protein
MTKAEAEGADLLLIDTAGRLQNRADLMEELAKIVRVIRKKDPEGAAQHAAGAGRDHRPERAEPGRDLPETRRCLGAGDDQARRHGAGRGAGGAGRQVRPADPCHRRGRADRRSAALRSRGFARALVTGVRVDLRYER